MEFLIHLWLPILVSAVAVWIVSAICWMAVGHHNKDQNPIPNEQAFINFLKTQSLKPGNYGFPDFQKCKGMSKEEKQKKWAEMTSGSPMGLLRVWGPMNMGANMFMTFLFFLVTSTIIAYLGHAALIWGTPFAKVFQVLGTAGVLAYCFASFPNDIWFQKSRRAMLMCFIDGIVFGLVTGAVFAWLWPK